MNMSQKGVVWDDLYNGEMIRSGDAEIARNYADRNVTLVSKGTYYVEDAWKRAVAKHIRNWWGAYVTPVAFALVILFVIWLIRLIPGPTPHWAGIEGKWVATTAENDLVAWYKKSFDARGSDVKSFRAGLFPLTVNRRVKGGTRWWFVRFSSASKPQGQFCVLTRDNAVYVRKC